MNTEMSNLVHIKSKCDEIRTHLRKHRNDSGLTQDNIAEWVGVTRKQIIEFENGSRFDIELLCNLCDKLGIDLRLNYFIT